MDNDFDAQLAAIKAQMEVITAAKARVEREAAERVERERREREERERLRGTGHDPFCKHAFEVRHCRRSDIRIASPQRHARARQCIR